MVYYLVHLWLGLSWRVFGMPIPNGGNKKQQEHGTPWSCGLIHHKSAYGAKGPRIKSSWRQYIKCTFCSVTFQNKAPIGPTLNKINRSNMANDHITQIPRASLKKDRLPTKYPNYFFHNTFPTTALNDLTLMYHHSTRWPHGYFQQQITHKKYIIIFLKF